MFLYACSLPVPPSAFQMSTTWPFLTSGPNRSPSPYTAVSGARLSCSRRNCPSGVAMIAAAPASLAVSSRAPARNSSRQSAPARTRADSAPEVSTAHSPSWEERAAAGSLSSASSVPSIANAGGRYACPVRWVTFTAITSGAGALSVRVIIGPLSRSPRCRTGTTVAWTVSVPGPASTSSTWTGWNAWTPGRSIQRPSVNFMGGVCLSWLLDGADGDAAGQRPLEDKEEDDGGKHSEQRRAAGGQRVHDVLALQGAERDRHGLVLVGDQEDQRQEELVPRPDEEEHEQHAEGGP